jgi:hypothetical protein
VARVKATAFTGASPSEVDPDALTYKRIIKNAQAEAAKIYDQLTGENAEASTINHSGGGRGCPLGAPLWNMLLRRSLRYTDPDTGAKQASPAAVWLVAHPFFFPKGETNLRVELRGNGDFLREQVTVVVTNTSGTVVARAPLEYNYRQNDPDNDYLFGLYYADLALTGNTLYLIYVEHNSTGTFTDTNRILSWSGRFKRSITPSEYSDVQQGATNFTLDTTGGLLKFTDIDELLYADYDPINGYLLTKTANNINALIEYVSGAPCAGNEFNTLADSGAIDPASSAFHACTRSVYANEPEIDFTVWCEAFGAGGANTYHVVNTGVSPPVRGMLEWFAPYPLTVSTSVIRQISLMYPDFQTASSRLKFCVLVGTSQPADITNWTATVSTGVSTAADAFNAAFTAYPGVSGQVAIAEATAVPFSADAYSTTELRLSRSGIFDTARDEIFVLGICLYFQSP